MTLKSRLTSVEVPGHPWPLFGSPCKCLAAFFREEFARHHRCLEEQREYFSQDAIEQAEEFLARVMEQIDRLCQRQDASDIVADLLRQLDLVTNLSAFTQHRKLH